MDRVVMRAQADQDLRCDEARPLLSAALDGEVDDPTEARLARHIARCGACARFRADLVDIDRVLAGGGRDGGSEPEGAAAPPAWEPIGAFVAATQGERPRARSRSRRLLARGSLFGHPLARAVAAVLVVVGGYVAVRGFMPDRFRPAEVREEAAREASGAGVEPGAPEAPAVVGAPGAAERLPGAALAPAAGEAAEGAVLDAVRRARAAAEGGIDAAPEVR